MRYLLPALLPLLLTTCTAPAAAPSSPTPPNIVIILADDMGFSDIGCYGGEIETPTLDRLAANSRRYRNFYNTGRCCPTRASLLTGEYSHRVGMARMVTAADQPRPPGPMQGYLSPDAPTIAEHLRAAGYGTYMSGKWHVGEAPDYWPRKRGFDHYFGLISGASSYWTLRRDQPRQRTMVHEDTPWEPPTDGSFYATHAYSDTAVAYVTRHAFADAPLFLYLAYTAPHWPLHAPEATTQKYLERYRAGWDKIRADRFAKQQRIGVIDSVTVAAPMDPDIPRWTNQGGRDTMARKMAIYAAMVEEMDRGIGRVLNALDKKDQLDNTLVLFLSDNGGCDESVWQRGLDRPGSTPGGPGSYEAYLRPWAQVSNTPFRRYKAWMHEGGIATPLLLHWPGGGVAPEWTDQQGHVIDLLPTCLSAAGVPLPDLPGVDQLAPAPADRPLFWEHYGRAALRRGDYKLVRGDREGFWQLYNLLEDPTELRDLAAEQPKLVDSLAGIWENMAAEVGAK